MFGATVLDIDGEHFAEALDAAKRSRGTDDDLGLDADDLSTLVETFKGIVRERAGRDFPQDPREQMDLAMRAVFDSWNTDRARLYRRQERIPEDLGTAVNIQAMVFGNFGMDSGSGVAFTRDPASGNQGEYGDYLQNAQGEDVVAGIRNTVSLADFAKVDQTSHDDLMAIMARLERHYRDMCDIEFTVERGKLWMLQTRVGKRTPEAAFRIAVHMVDEGLIQMDEAVLRVNGAQLAQLMFPRFDEAAERTLLATGMNASPGAAVGRAVFDSDTAVEWAERGDDVILVRKETNPDDLRGMVAARGILTSRGGKTSHAAVVARGMGRTCVCGAEALDVDTKAREFRVRDGIAVSEGDLISIDGTTGEVFAGEVPVSDALVVRHFEGEHVDSDLVAAVARIMAHADGARRLRVRANADNPEEAARARRFGAQGIGLCRTEHMFLGERRELVERLIVAEDDAEQVAALDALLPLQRQDFTDIFEAMDGLPVTIRLIDPPLHEFLPDITDLSVKVALAAERGERDEHDEVLLQHVRRLHEQNPMLGLRGVRLGIQIPGLFRMQARAILEAAADRTAAGMQPLPEIMIPLVASVRERLRDRQGRHRRRRHRDRGGPRRDPRLLGRHHDRAAACSLPGRPDRGRGRLLLLRHQRPDPDGVGLLARRRRGGLLLALLRARDLRRLAVRVDGPARGRRDGRDGDPEGPRGQPRPQGRRLRRARRRPALDPLLRRGRPRLRVLLALPGAGRAAGGRPLGAGQAQALSCRTALRTGRRPAAGDRAAPGRRRCRRRRRAPAGARARRRAPRRTYAGPARRAA